MVQIPAEETSAFFFPEFTMNKKGLWQRLKIPLSHTEKNLGQMVLPSLQSSGFCCYCDQFSFIHHQNPTTTSSRSPKNWLRIGLCQE